MIFVPYESKPVTCRAFQITETMKIVQSDLIPANWSVSEGHVRVKFKAYETPKVGDWVVRLTETDTYHCTDEVFRARNIVPSEFEQAWNIAG